jgi:signal transduction histidine kinase
LVRRELRPLQTLSDAVSSYDPSKAGATLPRAQRQELALIRKAVIELGHRLTRRIANERAFSAHAAHALRTPLAGMDAQLAMALRECGHNERPRLVRTREAARRLSRVVSSLLTLFRSGIETQWQKADLETLLDKVALDNLSIRFIGSVDVEADPDLLTAALVNLLDNVVRHGGNRVTIQVEMTTRFQVITLTDNGPGVTADRLAALQSALESQHYGGHTGLGLMMAGMVARAHGGTLRISNLGVGMAAELTLRRMPNP